jgi:hypothetical protein
MARPNFLLTRIGSLNIKVQGLPSPYTSTAFFTLSLFFNPEKGDSMFLRNVSKYQLNFMMSHPRRQQSS